MSRTLRRTLVAGAVVAALLWTLFAVGGWWLLQTFAGLLEGGSTATAMQAVAPITSERRASVTGY